MPEDEPNTDKIDLSNLFDPDGLQTALGGAADVPPRPGDADFDPDNPPKITNLDLPSPRRGLILPR